LRPDARRLTLGRSSTLPRRASGVGDCNCLGGVGNFAKI
jgi:hypothetical protein